MPDAGTHPSQSAKMTMRTMPSQKTGMLAPKSDTPALTRSRNELRRVADAIPRAIPPTVERASAHAVRRRVARREVQHHEDHDRDAQQHRHQQQEPARDVAPHGRGLT